MFLGWKSVAWTHPYYKQLDQTTLRNGHAFSICVMFLPIIQGHSLNSHAVAFNTLPYKEMNGVQTPQVNCDQ